MSESTVETQVEDDKVLTASDVLVAARKSLGLSQQDIADELYLTPAVIRHIDENTMEKITKQAFVRGYLRSYSRLVKLNGDEVVRLFDEHQGGAQQSIEIRGVTQEPVGSIRFTGPVFQTGILGLVGLVVIILLVWVVTSGAPESEEPAIVAKSLPKAVDQGQEAARQTGGTEINEVNSEDSPVVRALLSGPAPQSNSAQAELPANTTESTRQALREDAINFANGATPAALVPSSEVSVAREREGELSYINVDAGGRDFLEFTFTDECWVEIEDAEGAAVYGDLNRAGDVLRVSGQAPFEVLFGKAPAASMSFNGRKVDLAAHTTSVQTAKVRVGD